MFPESWAIAGLNFHFKIRIHTKSRLHTTPTHDTVFWITLPLPNSILYISIVCVLHYNQYIITCKNYHTLILLSIYVYCTDVDVDKPIPVKSKRWREGEKELNMYHKQKCHQCYNQSPQPTLYRILSWQWSRSFSSCWLYFWHHPMYNTAQMDPFVWAVQQTLSSIK